MKRGNFILYIYVIERKSESNQSPKGDASDGHSSKLFIKYYYGT